MVMGAGRPASSGPTSSFPRPPPRPLSQTWGGRTPRPCPPRDPHLLRTGHTSALPLGVAGDLCPWERVGLAVSPAGWPRGEKGQGPPAPRPSPAAECPAGFCLHPDWTRNSAARPAQPRLAGAQPSCLSLPVGTLPRRGSVHRVAELPHQPSSPTPHQQVGLPPLRPLFTDPEKVTDHGHQDIGPRRGVPSSRVSRVWGRPGSVTVGIMGTGEHAPRGLCSLASSHRPRPGGRRLCGPLPSTPRRSPFPLASALRPCLSLPPAPTRSYSPFLGLTLCCLGVQLSLRSCLGPAGGRRPGLRGAGVFSAPRTAEDGASAPFLGAGEAGRERDLDPPGGGVGTRGPGVLPPHPVPRFPVWEGGTAPPLLFWVRFLISCFAISV